MRKLTRLLLLSGLSATAVAQTLPAPAAKPLDFEPQLILTDPNAPPAGGITTDLEKLENGLQRAKRNAVADEALFRRGILAKVEAERSVLKVVMLTSKLSEARVQAARAALEKLADGSKEAKAAAEQAVQEAEATAKADAEAWHKAQVGAAELNLWRTQQLLAWGGATKAQVARAKEQLAALQGTPATTTPTAKVDGASSIAPLRRP
jgi:predicted pyridoxine 5'-phosphate oxidase superfamily flavin-nucleotide-binding protein